MAAAARGVPEGEGLLIFEGTSFPKQGPHWVDVARQVLWRAGQDSQLPSGRHRGVVDGRRGYLLGAALYLPTTWVTDAARRRARIPATVRFQEKWRQALTLLRQVRASEFTVTGV